MKNLNNEVPMAKFALFACDSGESATLFPESFRVIEAANPPDALTPQLLHDFYRAIAAPKYANPAEATKLYAEYLDKVAKVEAMSDIQQIVEFIYEDQSISMDTIAVIDKGEEVVAQLKVTGEMIFSGMQDDSSAYNGTSVWFDILMAHCTCAIEIPRPAELQED